MIPEIQSWNSKLDDHIFLEVPVFLNALIQMFEYFQVPSSQIHTPSTISTTDQSLNSLTEANDIK